MFFRGLLLYQPVLSLLGVDPSIPENLVNAIKERIVIPTVQLEISESHGCSSLDGPFGLRGGSGHVAVGGFTIGNFYGNSLQTYFQAIGRLVGEVRDLAELQRAKPEISEGQISEHRVVQDYHEIRLTSQISGISGQAKFHGIVQGLRDGEHVWWCMIGDDRKIQHEISDACGFEISVFTVNMLRFFPVIAASELEISLNFRSHKNTVNQVLLGKNFSPQYVALSEAAAVTSLTEATAKKMRFKEKLVETPKLKLYEFLSVLNDSPTQTGVERLIITHINTNKPLEQLVLNDPHIMRKYAQFLDERQPEKFASSSWGVELVARLRHKDRLESLTETLAVLNSL
jgi:hypothetical protein